MAVQSETTATGRPNPAALTEEDRSKDEFFTKVAKLSEAMINAHGREFAMGALILAARFIAENKAFTKPADAACGCGSDHEHQHHQHHKT